jgi:predicted metal-binding protein
LQNTTDKQKLNSHADKFESLKKIALNLGVIDAKIIPANKIVIEDRVVLKCSLGCEKYGKTLACPPHAPTPEKFRKIVGEYTYAMFMQFKSTAELAPELIKYLAKTPDITVPTEIRAKIDQFWLSWKNDGKKQLDTVIQLEKAAAKEGFILAAGFVAGTCTICPKCNVENGICVHPEMRRFSEEGLGVNVKATAEKAGMMFTLPFNKNPESYALLLID